MTYEGLHKRVLDKAVAAGRMTREEADARYEAILAEEAEKQAQQDALLGRRTAPKGPDPLPEAEKDARIREHPVFGRSKRPQDLTDWDKPSP